MIEINLVPDVKQELIRAQRLRATVISMATLIGIVSGGVVVVLSLYVFGAQTLRSSLADNAIKSEQEKITKVDGLDNALTIQAQLQKLSELSKDRQVNSRIFDLLTAIVPSATNSIAISKTSVNTDNRTIDIEAQADSGYAALEAFLKTIEATRFEYSVDNSTKSVALASHISDSGRSYGEDASGKKVLRFTVSFVYPDELFMRSVTNATIVGPERKNVTDSFEGVPASLFTSRAADNKEGNN
jgi:Tfp pilus assembly protein PilN